MFRCRPAASKRARNPLVIVGNAIFTLLILLVVGGGGAVVFGKLRFEAPGPLQADKIVNIPQRAGLVEIADLLAERRRDRRAPARLHRRRVRAEGALRAEVRRIPVPQARQRA